jgi:hypothetical protein
MLRLLMNRIFTITELKFTSSKIWFLSFPDIQKAGEMSKFGSQKVNLGLLMGRSEMDLSGFGR